MILYVLLSLLYIQYDTWSDHIGMLTYMALPHHVPADFEARRRLRSASSSSLVVRRTRLSTIGDRAFPVATARIWNGLPPHVTSASLLPVFRRRLKKHLFRRCFP